MDRERQLIEHQTFPDLLFFNLRFMPEVRDRSREQKAQRITRANV